MRTSGFFSLLLFSLLLQSCRTAAPPVLSVSQAESSVRKFLALQDSVASAEDLHGFMQLVADDAVFLPPGDKPLEGAAAIRAWYDNFFRAYDVQLQHIPGVSEVEGAVIIHRGNARGTLQPRGGGSPVSFDNKYLFAMRFDPDGSLRHWRAMFNANPTAVHP